MILQFGDKEKNPGPEYEFFSDFHQNIRSIRNKIKYRKNNFLDFDTLCFTVTKTVERNFR